MTTPDRPKDPEDLSLAPSSSGGSKPRADFSNIRSGSSSTEADADDSKPDFSNVQSGSSSTEASAVEQTYTVQKGDTLSHVSQQFYGKASQWKQIFEANRDQLDDPDRIKPGQILKIPAQTD